MTVHFSRRWTFRSLPLMALVLALIALPCLAADSAKPLKVCLVSGSLEYESNESLAALQKYLEAKYPIRCSRAFIEGRDETHLPGLENLADCDVMLLFTRRLKLEGQDLERIKSYCQSGKPIVGVRTASHAIQTWLDLDKEVLGGNYHGHYGADDGTDIKITEKGKDHPILKDFALFHSAGSLYKNEGLATDNEILMTGTNPEHTDPIAWTRMHKGGRVFYTSLGHQQDFTQQGFLRLLANALFWTAGREPQAPSAENSTSAPRSEVEVQEDVVYGKAAGEDLLLDLAMPKGLDHAVPLIIWIHGGAWQGGNKGEFAGLVRDSAAAGYVAASLNYRLAPKHVFPAQVEDCKCAVRWLRANAERLHIDPQKIGVVGSSAGAHLAMMLGAMEPSDGLEGNSGFPEVSSRVQVVVSYAGPTDLRAEYPAVSKPLLATFLGGPQPEKEEAARLASPITYVSPGDAPMLLIQGTKDPLVPYQQAFVMIDALTRAGVPGRAEIMLGEGHGWPKENSRVTQATYEFLRRYLKP